VSTEEITNYHKVDERVITGGQPTERQIRSAAEEGVQVLINLATIDPRYSLDDEGGLARSLGLAYYHIPVAWEQPTDDDFNAFVRAMNESAGKRVLIHCAANYRVTAFYSLYAMQNLGWSEDQADALRASIWKRKYLVWDEFIQNMKTKIKAGQP
jgi:protein tyrosine phosphatase (PTP) superfamily phosphohydrolase (DUF442 family)